MRRLVFTLLRRPRHPSRHRLLSTLPATELVGGRAQGELLHTDVGLSFWGGVDPLTGRVIDHTHPLAGQTISSRVLAVPNGRGSCTGSQVVLELLLNGIAPAAMLLRQPDAILSLGVIVAEELFGKSIPIVSLGAAGFDAVAAAEHVAVEGATVLAGTQEEVAAAVFECDNNRGNDTCRGSGDDGLGSLGSLGSRPSTADELLRASGLELSEEERAVLGGAGGEAAAVAMRILARAGAIDGAARLIPITQVHIDGCTYIGPGGLRFAETLARLGAQVAVPTTLNSTGVDRRRWRALGIPADFAEPAAALGDAYVAMGCSDTSFTCAPYLLDSRPELGDQVGWGESNAVVFANSVLGARTTKMPDYLDICAAITGRVPLTGPHLDEHRRATVVLDAAGLLRALRALPAGGARRRARGGARGGGAAAAGGGGGGGGPGDYHGERGAESSSRSSSSSSSSKNQALCSLSAFEECADAFYPVLGYLCGLKSEAAVPVVVGLEDLDVTLDHLKAFSAAFGSTAAVPMFHMAGVTPEAPDAATALGLSGRGGGGGGGGGGDGGSGGEGDAATAAAAVETIELTLADLAMAWRALDSGAGAVDSAGGASDVTAAGGDSPVQLVALGNPHLSLRECATLAEMVAGGGGGGGSGETSFHPDKNHAGASLSALSADDSLPARRHDDVRVVATMGRAIYAEAEAAGYVATLADFGVSFINDTCWCMLAEPVVAAESTALITNSGKYAHYAPGLVNKDVRFSNLEGCLEAARTGRAPPPPAWVALAEAEAR